MTAGRFAKGKWKPAFLRMKMETVQEKTVLTTFLKEAAAKKRLAKALVPIVDE